MICPYCFIGTVKFSRKGSTVLICSYCKNIWLDFNMIGKLYKAVTDMSEEKEIESSEDQNELEVDNITTDRWGSAGPDCLPFRRESGCL
jgi:Zn-finger nucleic acid-binding protein